MANDFIHASVAIRFFGVCGEENHVRARALKIHMWQVEDTPQVFYISVARREKGQPRRDVEEIR